MEFRDLKAQYQKLKPQIDEAINSTLNNGIFILGEAVSNFETRIAEYVGVKHCISCANGTDAITMSLMAFNIGKGDAVFVPNFTYVATASPVALIGATPIFVDIDPDTYNICPNALEIEIKKVIDESKLTPKLIIPVDLFGLPADYPAIESIAQKYGLKILEDSAQGFGGNINGKLAGAFGDMATTSFFPAKPLGCYGDGGAIFTNDDATNDYLRMLRVNGASPSDKYNNRLIGLNSRLDTLQAAILQVKLDAFISYELDKVNEVADWYTNGLKDVVKTPEIKNGWFSSYAQYSVICKNSSQREKLRAVLTENNIPSMIYYPLPLNRQKAFEYLGQNKLFAVTEDVTGRVLSLPMHPYLTKEDVEKVINVVVDCANK